MDSSPHVSPRYLIRGSGTWASVHSWMSSENAGVIFHICVGGSGGLGGSTSMGAGRWAPAALPKVPDPKTVATGPNWWAAGAGPTSTEGATVSSIPGWLANGSPSEDAGPDSRAAC